MEERATGKEEWKAEGGNSSPGMPTTSVQCGSKNAVVNEGGYRSQVNCSILVWITKGTHGGLQHELLCLRPAGLSELCKQSTEVTDFSDTINVIGRNQKQDG